MSKEIKNFKPAEFSKIGSMVVYNPHPYPIEVTMMGQILGGRETAVVAIGDPVATKLIKRGLVMRLDESVLDEPEAPVKAKKKAQKS